MKKIIFLLVVVAAVFTSCQNNDPNSSNSNGSNSNSDYTTIRNYFMNHTWVSIPSPDFPYDNDTLKFYVFDRHIEDLYGRDCVSATYSTDPFAVYGYSKGMDEYGNYTGKYLVFWNVEVGYDPYDFYVDPKTGLGGVQGQGFAPTYTLIK